MTRTVVFILIYIFEMLTGYCFFSSVLNKKIKSNLLILGIGTLLFIAAAIFYFVFESELLNIFTFFTINFLFAIICYECSLKLAVIYSIALEALMNATEAITIFGISYLFNVPVNSYTNDESMLIIMSVVCKLLYFMCSQLLCLVIKRNNHDSGQSKHFLPLFIFPALSALTSMIFILISLTNEIEKKYKIIITLICIIYFFACNFIFIYYQRLLENEDKVNELVAEKRYFELNSTYMNLLQSQNDELQMVFHDTKHHYTALRGMESVDEVREYISKIYPELESKNSIAFSKNRMLDLILNKYVTVCKNNGIKFNIEVKTASLDYIDDAELSVLINNILDNAVEAAVKSAEKQIDFSLRNINDMDLLSVINSCDNPPEYDSNKLITSKFDAHNHGFGTRIISRHAQKNNGKYEWFYDEKEHKFHLTILFQKQ